MLLLVVLSQELASGFAREHGRGVVLRVAMKQGDVDSLDPALAVQVQAWSLLETTCARLLRPTVDAQGASVLRPEVAARVPRTSRDRRTVTFTLRAGYRFSDGTPVRANAFARAINRTLDPSMRSPWADYLRDIVGAGAVLAGRRSTAPGVVARGLSLTIRLARPVPDFHARTTFLCAVPPALPSDREGIADSPAAGPYYVAVHRAGERVAIRRNRFYGGTRPRHVEGFDVDLRLDSHEEVLDRVERGEADWGWALPQTHFDPSRRLAGKYGVNRGRFFVRPGTLFRGYAFNLSRPLFRDNPLLRRAVSLAIDRSALRRVAGGRHSSRLTDQYLPFGMRGFRDARIYPLDRPDLARARALARGRTRGGRVVLYTVDLPFHLAFAQSIQQSLAKIGLEVRIRGVPLQAYFGGLMARGPYDLGFVTWVPDYDDPYAVLNVQLDGQFVGSTNWSRFDSPAYNRLLRRVARLEGAERYRAYGALDVRIARDAAPMVAIDFVNDATLVSGRVGCVGRAFDLAALCVK